MAEPAQVRQIAIGDIKPNPHNPRRLFDDEPMGVLRESIAKLGILVPLTVYQPRRAEDAGKDTLVLLDGERRWRCAQVLRLATVPAIVVDEPSPEQNILTMFHIHNLREGWQLMPTALKLQTLMRSLDTTSERKLKELTKLTIPQIRRCKILLTYQKSFRDLMLAPPSERMKADFFIELQRIRGPAVSERFPPWVERGDAHCIRIVLDKYENKVIRAVTEFRHLAEVYRASERLGKKRLFFHQLDRFLNRPKLTVWDVSVPGASYAKEAREIRRTASRLLNQVDLIEFEDISSDRETVDVLKKLLRVLRKKLDDALLLSARDAAS